jgi:hypothetical protein
MMNGSGSESEECVNDVFVGRKIKDAKEELEESVYDGNDSDCEEDDNKALPTKKRGKKLNYIVIQMFPTEKLALEDFSKDKMLQRGLCWGAIIDTEERKVLNFKCSKAGCSSVGRLIFDNRDNSFRHEEINEADPGNGRAPGNQHRHDIPNSDIIRNERGLSEIQKEWITDAYSSHKSCLAIIDERKCRNLKKKKQEQLHLLLYLLSRNFRIF